MTFARAFQLSGYCLLFSGFLTLFATGGVGVVLAAGYMLTVGWWVKREIFGARRWLRIRDGGQTPKLVSADGRASRDELSPGLILKTWQQLILVMVILVGFVLDFLLISGFVVATVHLLVFISLLKVFSRKSERDYLLLYFISFSFLLLASTFAISIVFLALLIVYIFFCILTFILFESKKAYEENRSAHFSLKGYASVALVITTLIVLIAGPVFLVIPRTSLGLFGNKHHARNLSGFSDKVNLGDVGKIIQNNDIVMRVRLDTDVENLPLDFKWRGIALDHYSGKGWSNTGRTGRRIDSRGQGSFLVAQDRRYNEFQVQQAFLLKPFTNILFGAPEMLMIHKTAPPNDHIVEDANGSYRTLLKRGEFLRYTVVSDVMTRNEKLARRMDEGYPDEIRKRYLQLPSLHPSVSRLTNEITRSQNNLVGKALTIESFLKGNYDYSLENLSAVADDPLYDFLFLTKFGHCEYFATAQTVMMRILGIPARIVNGFKIGEFNDWSEYFVVRQLHAHSWAEGYFPGAGWVEFDSTPGSYGDPPIYWLRMVGQLLDAVDIFWTELITFDRLKQVGFFHSVASNLQESWDRVSTLSYRLGDLRGLGSWESLKPWLFSKLIVVIPVFITLGLAWTTYRFRRYFRFLWKQRVLKQEVQDIAPEYYFEMLDVLRRKGFVKKPSETPAEFADRVSADLPSPLLGRITDLYYLNRFGNLPLAPKDLSEIYISLKQLRHLQFISGH